MDVRLFPGEVSQTLGSRVFNTFASQFVLPKLSLKGQCKLYEDTLSLQS